jgi:uncharacterized membrane protein YgcG
MNSQQLELWQRLLDFVFDKPNAILTFSKRLARDNDWTEQYALKAIAEYLKFIFLAVVAGHQVTPSEQVDRVWHLHLTYTQSYWNDFCPNVLQMTLHHAPTQGGSAERQKFLQYYSQTLESYEKFFGTPPKDIWTDPKIRFNFQPIASRLWQKEIALIFRPKIWLLVTISILSVLFHSFNPVLASLSFDRQSSIEMISVNPTETITTPSSSAPNSSPSAKSSQNSESESKSSPWLCIGFWVFMIIWSFFSNNNSGGGGSGWSIGIGGGGDGDSGCSGCGGCGGCGCD